MYTYTDIIMYIYLYIIYKDNNNNILLIIMFFVNFL